MLKRLMKAARLLPTVPPQKEKTMSCGHIKHQMVWTVWHVFYWMRRSVPIRLHVFYIVDFLFRVGSLLKEHPSPHTHNHTPSHLEPWHSQKRHRQNIFLSLTTSIRSDLYWGPGPRQWTRSNTHWGLQHRKWTWSDAHWGPRPRKWTKGTGLDNVFSGRA